MKKLLLILAATFLLLEAVPSASAQYVNVGSGDDNNSAIPLNNYYNHSISQSIYLASEMGGSTNIHSISYQHFADASTDSCYRDVKVYLAHTSKTSFSDDNDWVTSVGTLVYDGPLFIPNTSFDEWVTILFDQSFAYNGTSNLVVTIIDDAVSDYANHHQYESTEYSSHLSMYAYNDETAYSTSTFGSIASISDYYGYSYYRPNTRFFTSSSSSMQFIEIGTQSNNTTSFLPTYCFYQNTVSQQIYMNNEVGGDGTALYGIQFYHLSTSSSNEINRHIRLYADWNPQSEFTSSTDWGDVWSSSLVFEGTIVLPGGGSEGWYTIWFDQPYVSQSGNNLVIAIDADDDNYSSGHSFRCHGTDNDMAIFKYSDEQTYDATEMYDSGIEGATTPLRSSVRFITATSQASEPLYVTLTAPTTGQANEYVQVQADYPDDVTGYEWYTEDHSSWNNTSATGAEVKWKVGGTYKVRITVYRGSETAADSAMITISPFEPQTTVESNAQWYGFIAYTENKNLNHHFYKFDMHHPEQAQSISDSLENIFGVEYVDGIVYLFNNSDHKIYKTSFSSTNPVISSLEEVSSISDEVNIKEMSYNYVDNTLYAIASRNLASIELATGSLTIIGALEKELQGFAINSQGKAYGISLNDGILYSVNLADATLTQVGSTGKGCEYVQSMAFDRNNGELFWAQYSTNSENGLCKVNTTTGQADIIGFMDNGAIEMTGLFMVPGVQSIQTANNVEVDIYPNPTSDKVIVDAADLMYVVVLDLNGRAVMTSYQSIVDLSDQPTGIYMLRIVTSDGTVLRKVVKK